MYRYRQDGVYGKITLGRYPDLTLKAARDKRDELAAQVVTGRSPAQRLRVGDWGYADRAGDRD
jgi:hypothetical protein